MSKPSEHFYEFGRFRVDAVSRLLLHDGAPVPLTLKAFDTLLALVENRGRLVEKDELLRRVWPDTAVEENNLTQQVSALRKVLGEDAEGRRYIETFPRRGYRFVAEVREVRGVPTAAGAKAETTEVAGGQTATAFVGVEAQAGDGARAGVRALAGRAAPLCLQDGLLLSQKRQPPPQKERAATGGGEGSRQTLQTSHAQTGLPTAEPAAAPRPRARRRVLLLSALFVTLAAAASTYLWASRGRAPSEIGRAHV
jgi:DNA-binding winged helix-turn-helix (wHTH) protein